MKTAASWWLTCSKQGDLFSPLINMWLRWDLFPCLPAVLLMLTHMLLPSRWTSQRRQGEMLCKQETEGWERTGKEVWRIGLGEERMKEIPSRGDETKWNLWDSWNSLASGHAVAGTAGNENTWERVLPYLYIHIGIWNFLVTRRKTRACRREVESHHVHVSGLPGQPNQPGHAAYTSKMIHLSEICPLSKFAFSSGNIILIPGPQDQWLGR